MHNFCAYGGDNYICSYARTRMMTKEWDIIGLDCYIYTAINAMSMQKSILNMLKAMKVDIREISIYYK